MKIYIIGSVKESENMIKIVANHFEALGNDVRYVEKEYGAPLECLISKCYSNIENWADIVVVVPKCLKNGNIDIGSGTAYEIAYTKRIGKPVMIYSI